MLNDINSDIYKGEMLCIVGPTGCGKTTFLNCLSRFIPITEGSILVDGAPADPRVHNIAFVFQEVSAIPWLTVEDNIRFGLRIKRLPEEEIERRVERMLDIVGLRKYRTYFPQQLSASMEQRWSSPGISPSTRICCSWTNPTASLMSSCATTLRMTHAHLEGTGQHRGVYHPQHRGSRVPGGTASLHLPKPCTIREEVIVDLPRPRRYDDPEFVRIRDYVTERIKWW